MMKILTGKTAIVTGAAAPRGIGRAAALELAAQGANVIVTDVAGSFEAEGRKVDRLELLRQTVAEIRSQGGCASALETDVTDQAQIRACVNMARAEHSGLDILVNNAGTTVGTGPFLESDAEQWTLSFQVNLLGPMMFCQEAIRAFQDRDGGVIVNVGSTGSLGAEAGFGAYTAMKHGVVGLTKTIAAEFGSAGVRCNAVCPGYVMTDMHAGANERIATERGMDLKAVTKERYSGVAMRRAGTPEEIAETIAFLAGPASSYITGTAIPVSGGTPVGL